MKQVKRLWALLLALVMVLALGVTASATEPTAAMDLYIRYEGHGAPGSSESSYALAGGVFTLTQGSTVYTSAPSDENGLVKFTAVPTGTYQLEQKSAPLGYEMGVCKNGQTDNAPAVEITVTSGQVPTTTYTGVYAVFTSAFGHGYQWPSGSGAADPGAYLLPTFRSEYSKTTVEIPFTKTVALGGSVNPGEQTFELEVTGVNTGNVQIDATVKTTGKGDFNGKIVISGTKNDVANCLNRGITVVEKDTGADNWTYSDKKYFVVVSGSSWDGTGTPALAYSQAVTVNGQEEYAPVAALTFINTYTLNTAEVRIPFAKVVKLGGNTAPGKQIFALEIFDNDNLNAQAYAHVTYTAEVTTNGAGTYKGEIVITGPENEVVQYTAEGFYVREKNTNTANWTYSDAVWYVTPNGQNGFTTRLAAKRTSANGDYYEIGDAAAMSFTNIYTRQVSHARPAQPTETQVTSAKTFDAGIGVYAVSALLSVTGGAWLVGKKHK